MKLREQLAELCHEQWSGWMKYLFSKCAVMPDGGRNISVTLVDKWLRQLNTKYKDLSEEEKESDRKEADKFLAILESELKSENENKWISVKDRLPEKTKDINLQDWSDEVLIWMDGRMVAKYYYPTDHWSIPGFHGDWRPTYWQLLPEPPK